MPIRTAVTRRLLLVVTMISLLAAIAVPPLHAQTETVLYNFTAGADGGNPYGGLVRDAKGDLYGTTAFANDTIVELTMTGAESTLYNLGNVGLFSGLIRDAKGNLYGATSSGGTYNLGTVFELTSAGTLKVLYNFTGGADGSTPLDDYLVRDSKGNLYGTTSGNYCTDGHGTVFEITPAGKETTLYTFAGGTDGACPEAGLVQDKTGNLYGTTYWGGAYGGGTVFEISKGGVETVLHSFGGASTDGQNPTARLVRDSAGNLYGTTHYGGANQHGTVFEITAAGSEMILYQFGGLTDGSNPFGGLAMSGENLYGTTYYGGSSNNGTVFKVTKTGAETVLYRFAGYPTDGTGPVAGVILDKLGFLYGTTSQGGNYGWGTVFKIVP